MTIYTKGNIKVFVVYKLMENNLGP